MTSNTECFVYIMLPGETNFTTAGRFVLDTTRRSDPLGRFIYGGHYRDNPDAVPLDPIELKITALTIAGTTPK